MIDFCAWRHVFGEPGKGVHAHRVCDIAVVDFTLTFALAYLVWSLMGDSCPFAVVLGACFGVGVLAHRLFCVRTRIDRFLFPCAQDT